MSSSSAPRCRHIKTNGTQCGSPAQRNESFCYFHQYCRPVTLEVRIGIRDYSLCEIMLPATFEDAHSIQLSLRQVTELILRRKIDDKVAGLVLYSLQIASSNLKRMELEKPQPEEVVTDIVKESEFGPPMAAPAEAEADCEGPASAQHERNAPPVTASTQTGKDKHKDENKDEENVRSDEDLPPGTIQACHLPYHRPDRRIYRRIYRRTNDRQRPLHPEPADAAIQ